MSMFNINDLSGTSTDWYIKWILNVLAQSKSPSVGPGNEFVKSAPC